MASEFAFPDWAFDDLPARVPAPPPSPEEIEADSARVNDLNNQFIDAKQQILFTGPQAFMRLRGSDAIVAADGTSRTLAELRSRTLDQAASAPQRERLAGMLDWHLADATGEIARHVAEQSDAWQQGVAARTAELATRQAALEAGDAEKVGFLALAAYDAEKARALKDGSSSEAAHESGRMAWSGAYRAAILAEAENDPSQAVELFRQARGKLDAQTRESLAPRIEALSRDARAAVLAETAMAPGADKEVLLDDPAISPEVKQLAESRIANRATATAATSRSHIDMLDRRLADEIPRALASATYMPGTYAAIADGYASAGDAERAGNARRLAANEPFLIDFAAATPANQAAALAKLGPGEVRDQAEHIEDATERLVSDDPLRWGTTAQRSNGVGALAPLDLLPSPANTPEAIADALARREGQARLSEVLSGRPALAMTKVEITALKSALDSAPLDGKQRMLRGLANGLSGGATARLALELAKQGPLADGYAIALSTYGARRAEQDALAHRIVDGLDRMKAASEGGKQVADTGGEWRDAFDARMAQALPLLDRDSTALLEGATTALYVQSTSLKGMKPKSVDFGELYQAVNDIRGLRPSERVPHFGQVNPHLIQINGGTAATALAPGALAIPSAAALGALVPVVVTAFDVALLSLAGLALFVFPLNSGDEMLPLTDDLRLRLPTTGSLYPQLERRVVKGIPNTSVGHRWVPFQIRIDVADVNGRQVYQVDRRELEQQLGAEAARRVLETGAVLTAEQIAALRAMGPVVDSVVGGLPIAYELRVGVSTDAGKTTTHKAMTDEEIVAVCPNYTKYLEIARRAKATVTALGVPNGTKLGTDVHKLVEAEIIRIMEEELKGQGVYDVYPEIALSKGEKMESSYHRPVGSSVIDILEINKITKTVCIYDVKTGNASFTAKKKEQYIAAAMDALPHITSLVNTFLSAKSHGYDRIYVMPVQAP